MTDQEREVVCRLDPSLTPEEIGDLIAEIGELWGMAMGEPISASSCAGRVSISWDGMMRVRGPAAQIRAFLSAVPDSPISVLEEIAEAGPEGDGE